MRMPITLSTYIGRSFLYWIAIGLAVCVSLMLLIDLLELLRRAAGRDVGFGMAVGMALLRLPSKTQQLAPFAMLFGSILCFTKLSRTSELVIARASGISVWQFLTPCLVLACVIGIFLITVYNPVAAAMLSRSEQLEQKYMSSRLNQLSVSKSGLWLRQRDLDSGAGETIIHAQKIYNDDTRLSDVIIFNFSNDYDFKSRIDAQEAQLRENRWLLKGVLINDVGKPPEFLPEYSLKTNLTPEQIQDSFSSPETLSFWELPSFIRTLEEAGFPAVQHKLYFHTTLAAPIMLASMVIIAAIFSLQYARRGRNGALIGGALVTGFLFYFLSKLASTLGTAGGLPIGVAAWIPAGVSIMIGIAMLLHLEDG